jgi:hypothetical protein
MGDFLELRPATFLEKLAALIQAAEQLHRLACEIQEAATLTEAPEAADVQARLDALTDEQREYLRSVAAPLVTHPGQVESQ